MGRLLTILCTDVSTENRSVPDTYQLLVRTQAEAHRGRLVKRADGICIAVFERPVSAVLTARALRHTLESEMPPDAAPPVRAAIATGSVTEAGEDVRGPAMETAQGLLGVTPSGRIWLTGETLSCLKPDEIQASSVGVLSLKGMAQPVKVVEAYRQQPLPWRFRVPIALFVILALVIAGLVSLLLCYLSIDSHRHNRRPKGDRIRNPQSEIRNGVGPAGFEPATRSL